MNGELPRHANHILILFLLFGLSLTSVTQANAVDINNVLVSAIKTDSVTINWDSTEAYTSWVEYGTTAAYGNSTTVAGLDYFSEVHLSGLTAGTPCHFRIHADNYLGQETISPDYTFTTRTQAEVEAVIRAARTDGGLPKIYYVKTDGNEAADGLSVATAWQDPSNAFGKADVGDTVYLLPGTWINETILLKKSGIDIAPITLAGYGGVPVLESNLTTLTAISCDRRAYVDIRDLYIRTYQFPVALYNMTRVNVTRVTTENSYNDGIYCRTASTYIHFDQVIVDKSANHGMLSFGYPYDSSYQDHIRFSRCSVGESHHNGIDIHCNNHYVTVEDSSFSKVTGSAAIFSHNFNNRYIMMRGNTLQDGDRGIWIVGTDDSFVYNNTCISTGAYGILIYRPDGDPPATDRTFNPGVHNVIAKDNVFRNFGTYQYDIYMLNHSDEMDVLSDLLFIGNSISNKYVFYGPGTTNVLISELPNSVTAFTINHPVIGTSATFSNNRVFTENTPNEPVYSSSRSELSLAGFTGTYKLQTYPMTARPISGTAQVWVNQFDVGLAKGEVLADFNAETTAPNQMDFIIGELKPEINYLVQRDGVDYHVVKSNLNACIAFSNTEGSNRNFKITETDRTAELITPAETVIPAPQLLSPLPPRSLTATASNQKITLSWVAPLQDGGSPVTQYTIYRGIAKGREMLLAQSNAGLTYADRAIQHGVKYYYQVTAVNATGESVRSNEASAVGIYHAGAENKIWVYPNPYVKGKSGNGRIAFSNLPPKATIRVFALSGALVQRFDHAAEKAGGQAEWDISGKAGGVYLYTVTYPGGAQKGKLCIVR